MDDQENRVVSLTVNSVIPFLPTNSRLSLPDWIRPSMLDAEQFHMLPVKRGDGPALRDLAAEYRLANTPATADERRSILAELRLATVPMEASAAETRAAFAKLLHELADVPADILRAACKAYCNHVDPVKGGARFFPRSPAEIRVFSNPIQSQRIRRAYRLSQMADAAGDVFNPEDRCTPEQAAAIMREFGFRSATAKGPADA